MIDCKRSLAKENSFDSADRVSSPILDLGAGNCLSRFDRVASPKNFYFSAPDVAVIPSGPDSARANGPEFVRPISPVFYVVFTNENFYRAIGSYSFCTTFFFFFRFLDFIFDFGMTLRLS